MCVSDLGAPIGAQESVHALRDHLVQGGSSLADFLVPEASDAAFSTVASGGTSLAELYDQAVKRWAAYASSLGEIPEEEFKVRAQPRPPGYCAQTVLYFGKLAVTTLLDYGATCNAMPEEAAMSILSHAVQTYSDFDDPQYPIVRMHKYRSPRRMDGVAAGKSLEIR